MKQRHLRVLDTVTEGNVMASAVKVAFATSNMKEVNQHFGTARSLAIYAVNRQQVRLLEVNEFGGLTMDGNEDKLSIKIDALDGCIAVYTTAIGASAIAQLKGRGIQPVKVLPSARIKPLLDELREQLRAGPTAWLAQAMERRKPKSPGRFKVMEAEGWEE